MKNTNGFLPLAIGAVILLPLSFGAAAELFQADDHSEWITPDTPDWFTESNGTNSFAENLPPVCDLRITTGECNGTSTEVHLDASGSYDPEGNELRFFWRVGCFGSLNNPISSTPIMTVPTVNGCDRTCNVQFVIWDGFQKTFCNGSFTLESPDICDTGKPQALEMIYTGEDCSATMHTQNASEVECDDFGPLPDQVRIIATGDPHDNLWFDGIVNVGETYSIDATNDGETKLRPRTFIEIQDLMGNTLQFVEFHTSCSQDLFIGNQFGANRIVGFTPDPGGGGMGMGM